MEVVHLILTAIGVILLAVILIHAQEVKEDLNIIMGLQEDFDAKINAANAALDGIAAAVTAEAQQVADFIAGLPPEVDTSALDGVVTRLGGVADSVSGVFEPPTA